MVKAQKDKKEAKACRGQRENPGRMVIRDNMDFRENLVSEVIQDIKDHQDSRVKRGIGVHLAHLEI